MFVRNPAPARRSLPAITRHLPGRIPAVTCQEIHDQIAAFVSDRIDEAEYRHKIEQHIGACPDCGKRYHEEIHARLEAQESARAAAAAREASAAIGARADGHRGAAAYAADRASTGTARDSWFDRFANEYVSAAGVGVAILLIVVGATMLYFGSQDVGAPAGPVAAAPVVRDSLARPDRPLNLFNAASFNYDRLRVGKLAVDQKSDDTGDLRSYFKEHGVGYPVEFGSVGAPLQGGFVSTHHTPNGERHFAHLVYSTGNTMLYLLEVPDSVLRKGDAVYLTDDAIGRLTSGEVLWEQPDEDRTLALFNRDGIVIAAVGNVDRPTMQHLLHL